MPNVDTKSLVFLLVVACLVGIPGAIAWAGSTARGNERLFQAGPALLIPAVFAWTVISHATASNEVDDWWRIAPFYAAVGAAVFWHFALITRVKERTSFHIGYAILFVPTFYLFCMLGMVLAIKFPL
jgi:hypothetical protein